MNRSPLPRTCERYITLGVALFFVASPSKCAVWRIPQQSAQSQQQSSESQQQASEQPKPPETPAQPAASGPKPRKIWSNDDVVSLRTPADNYLAEKEMQKAADAEAATKKAELARQIKEAGLIVELPSTREETEGLIKIKEEQAKDLQVRLDLLNHDLPEAEATKKAPIQLQIEAVSHDLRKIQLEIKVLQSHLETFPKAVPGEAVSTPPTPPAPPSPLSF
jgi:hypothetical protein